MKKIKYPKYAEWQILSERPIFEKATLDNIVREILFEVKNAGDKKLLEYEEKFDKVVLTNLECSVEEINEAEKNVSEQLKNAILFAKSNIHKFHNSQKEKINKIETTEGVNCWRKSVGIEKVGLYIPGGTAPLFSTVLMLAIPAKIANCDEIIMCSPPDKNGRIHPAILFAAKIAGVNKIYKLGGSQAIAAMAYGTETIKKVYKIFGPGNQFVTKAKEMVQTEGVAIDMPAGPSEVLIIADKTSKPKYVAADLLSQAEHGADSQVILLSNNEQVINDSIKELELQLEKLPRKEIAIKAIENSKAVLLNNIEDCFMFSNIYAPEHLIVAMEDFDNYIDKIINAGSVFLGNYSCESIGDYASGTNHTLPTNAYALNYSGVSLDSFVKKITFQHVSKLGISNIGKTVEIMAEAEELFAHKNAVTVRLLNN